MPERSGVSLLVALTFAAFVVSILIALYTWAYGNFFDAYWWDSEICRRVEDMERRELGSVRGPCPEPPDTLGHLVEP